MYVAQQYCRRLRQYSTVHDSLETVHPRRRGEAPCRHNAINFVGQLFSSDITAIIGKAAQFRRVKENSGGFHAI